MESFISPTLIQSETVKLPSGLLVSWIFTN